MLALGFIVLAVAQTIASWSADLVEAPPPRPGLHRRRRGALWRPERDAADRDVRQWQRRTIANAVNSAVLAVIVAAICYAMMRVDGAELFPRRLTASAASEAVAAQSQGAADQKLVDALMRLMADERIYRHDNVTIGTLATKLAIPEYRLRRLINQRLGYRNFNVFLNEHRIAEAKAALADPSQAEVPVITIAMDAGFQSLGPFNRAFKATTGVTPTEYRRLKATAA